MYDRIVIAVDGSEEARTAARKGLGLAQRFDAGVTVVYVVEHRALRLTESDDEKTRLREKGEVALQETRELATELGQSITSELLEGKPAAQISRYADQQAADLVVLGRQGVTGLGKRLLGGVTENVLHHSDRPVLVVPGEHRTEDRDEYSRVLLPTDGSSNAESAVPHAATVAEKYGSAVQVLYVVDLQAAGGVFSAGGLDDDFIQRLRDEGREAVDRAASQVRETAPDLEIHTAVEQTTSFKGAATGIREHIQQNNVDFVVMGSHGRSNLQRHLLGSVASTVLRTVDVPVLVVK